MLGHGSPLPVPSSACSAPGVTVGSHGPTAFSASEGPGHGGIVAIRMRRGTTPILRNWNAVRGGIVRLVPVLMFTTSSAPEAFRQTSLSPSRIYQLSSTWRCVTGDEVLPAGNVQWKRPPPFTVSIRRISEPSGVRSSASDL